MTAAASRRSVPTVEVDGLTLPVKCAGCPDRKHDHCGRYETTVYIAWRRTRELGNCEVQR